MSGCVETARRPERLAVSLAARPPSHPRQAPAIRASPHSARTPVTGSGACHPRTPHLGSGGCGGGGLSELPRDGSCGPHLKAPALPAPGGAEGHPRLHRRRGPAGTGLAESPQATALPLRPRPLPAALSSPKPASGRRAPSLTALGRPRAAHSLGSTHLHASPS